MDGGVRAVHALFGADNQEHALAILRHGDVLHHADRHLVVLLDLLDGHALRPDQLPHLS